MLNSTDPAPLQENDLNPEYIKDKPFNSNTFKVEEPSRTSAVLIPVFIVIFLYFIAFA
jgi:hypothetical protein